jgi:hypothetical protein
MNNIINYLNNLNEYKNNEILYFKCNNSDTIENIEIINLILLNIKQSEFIGNIKTNNLKFYIPNIIFSIYLSEVTSAYYVLCVDIKKIN